MNKIKILLFLKVPPPVTGATIINNQIINSERIKSSFVSKSICLSYAKKASDIGKFNFSKPLRIISYWLQLLYVLLFFRPKYVYFQISPFKSGFYRDLLYVLLIKVFRKKLIIHLHGKGIKQRAQNSRLQRSLYKYVFKKSSVIHLSEILEYDVTDVFNGKIYFLPNGIKENIKKNKISSTNEIHLLFVSNLFISKGLFVLLKALEILKTDGYKFRCSILGDEGDISLEGLQNQIQQLGLSEQVSIVGPKFGHDKYPYFNAADIFIHPTLSDCFPLVLLEAMSFQLPVIASNEGAITDMIEDGVNGFIVDKNNPKQIAEKIEYLISNPKLMKQMGQSGKEKFEKNFTLEVFEKNFVRILNNIIDDDIS